MPFRLDKPVCPTCREPPAGTLETVPGLAELFSVGRGVFDYAGCTRIDWNAQKSLRRAGKILLECAEGHRWWSASRVVTLSANRTRQGYPR